MHIYIFGPKLLQWNFFLIYLSYLIYEVLHTNFSADFWTSRNFANIVAISGNVNVHSIVHLKVQSFLKKVKTASKSTHKSSVAEGFSRNCNIALYRLCADN